MSTVSSRWIVLLVVAVAMLVAAPVMAASPEAVTLGKYTEKGDTYGLADGKLTQAPEPSRNMFALITLGMKDTSTMLYEGLEGGVLGFAGKGDVVFAEAKSLDDVKKVPADKWTEAFEKFKPMSKDEAKEFRKSNPDKPSPRNAVAMMPGVAVFVVPLVNRPSDFVVCKTQDKLYAVEVVEHKKGADSVKVKIHPLQ